MQHVISRIECLIKRADNYLKQEDVLNKEMYSFKKDCAKIYIEVINANYSDLINDLAKRALSYEEIKISNPVFQWFYSRFKSRDAISYQAPFLIKHTDSDYNKRYIFWTRMKLKGLLYNIVLDRSFYE